MWIQIGEQLINLSKITELWKSTIEDKHICFGPDELNFVFFDNKEARDQEFERIKNILVNYPVHVVNGRAI